MTAAITPPASIYSTMEIDSVARSLSYADYCFHHCRCAIASAVVSEAGYAKLSEFFNLELEHGQG